MHCIYDRKACRYCSEGTKLARKFHPWLDAFLNDHRHIPPNPEKPSWPPSHKLKSLLFSLKSKSKFTLLQSNPELGRQMVLMLKDCSFFTLFFFNPQWSTETNKDLEKTDAAFESWLCCLTLRVTSGTGQKLRLRYDCNSRKRKEILVPASQGCLRNKWGDVCKILGALW